MNENNRLKLILIILTLLFLNTQSFAIEEVVLQERGLNPNYLSDVYYGRIEDSQNVSPILRLFSEKGYEFKNSKINSIKMSFSYSSNLDFIKNRGESLSAKHDFRVAEPGVEINFNENKSHIKYSMNLLRELDEYPNKFSQKISQFYISHDINENQTIMIGQGSRIPVNYEGSRSTTQMDTVIKAQIGRNFGDSRSAGIRNTAKYKYLDYDIGLYDSTRYMERFGEGADFTGYVMLKPFADITEQAGNLRIGSGYNIGNAGFSYNQYSFFAGYDWGNIHAKFEYANADGYNGIRKSRNNAEGFYSQLSYDITPKISVLGRYDFFNPDKHSHGDNMREYTAGVTYKLFKNCKIIFNYTLRDADKNKNSNMFMIATRFFL